MGKSHISDETRHFFDEAKALNKEVMLRLKETQQMMREQSLEMDKRSKEMDKRSKEMDRRFKETDRKIGRLGNRLGDFIEEMVRPGAVRLFRERGIEVHSVSRNVAGERDGESLEIDLLVVNDGEIVAVECKSALSIGDVDEHIHRIGKIKKVLPLYRDMKLMGAVAAMVIQSNVARYAYKKGLFVLAQSGDSMRILNDDKFQPETW